MKTLRTETEAGVRFMKAFVDLARWVGFRQAVRFRDDPFGDYGSRKKG
jgi:hypothetical protein